MPEVISRKMLVKTSVKDNNNKYWEGILYDNNDVQCRWGRVGAAKGQEKTFSGVGSSYLDKKIKEKTKKGYKEVEGINTGGSAKAVAGSQLKAVAKKQIRSSGCKTTDKLIDYLVQVNRHEIKTASGGKLTVNDDGLIKTDVGVVVTQDTLDRARGHLVVLSKCVSKRDFASTSFIDTLNEYLMAIPQKVGARRGWEKSFLRDQNDIQRQGALIDSMEATLQAYNDAPVVAGDGKEDTVFNVELTKITDKKELDRIRKLYESTQQSRHACSHLKVKNVFNVHISHMADAFAKDGAKKAPVWELWHGTRASNLLSILKCGLVVPPSNAAHVCGRMFGNGAYFSDQSTKSLNYAYGYWGGSRDSNCFMFLAQVGMGKSFTPRGPLRVFPKDYDSVYAVGGKSGVLNNEMIVPRVSQCNLTRLVEFGA